MKKLQVIRLLVLLPALFFLWGSAAAEGDANMERFLNVKQWKGVINVVVKKSYALYRNSGMQSETHRGNFITADGEIQFGDSFQDEQGLKTESGDPERGDFLNDENPIFNPAVIEKSMRSLGISEEEINEALKGLEKDKKRHLSLVEYKEWSLLPVPKSGALKDMEATLEEHKMDAPGLQDVRSFLPEMNTMLAGVDTSRVGSSGMHGSIQFRTHTESLPDWDDGCTTEKRKVMHGSYNDGSFELFMVANLRKKIYSFKWNMRSLLDGLKTTAIVTEDRCNQRYRSETIQEDWGSGAFLEDESGATIWEVKFEPLPATGMVLSGSKTITKKIEGGSEQVTFSWTFVPVDYELPEAWVEYEEGGDEWVPEDDNTVKVALKWGDNITPSQVRFTLYEMSEEPGTSLNSEDKNIEPDLEFAKENEANGFKISKSGKSYVAIKEELSGLSESVVLHAKDFGAYGKLKAEIKVDGHWFEATAKAFELPYLPVPYDKNNNLIADKWEKDVGIYSKNLSPDWDGDPYPQGQKSNGDGFTLYEEYRGFREIGHLFKKGDHEQVKDGHVRMDPMYKDVFIYDRDGLFLKYYKPYNPANLNWHLIDSSMMKGSGRLESTPDYRWVNFNTSKEHFLRNQYAVYLKKGQVSPNPEKPNDQGHTQEIELYEVQDCVLIDGNFNFPLKCWAKIMIYPQGLHNFISRNYKNLGLEEYTERVVQEMLGNAVIHEVGHTLGITHHREPGVQKFTDAGRTAGVSTCAMRYDTDKEMKHPELFNYYRATYCKAGDTYTVGEADAGGKSKQFPSHNCYGQINIKGD